MRPVVYLDTNVFIYLVERTTDDVSHLKRLFDVIADRRGVAITSELTLAEALAPHGDPPLSEVWRQAYLNLLSNDGPIVLSSVCRDVLIETANLRRAKPCKLPDAIHLATASLAGCRFVMSGDARLRWPASPFTFVEPDPAGFDAITAALHA